jgi:DNA-binding CsgD family transcriptional regulator
MTETVIVILNNSMETLGVSALCQSVGWQISGIKLVRDLRCEADFNALPEHSVVVIAIGPSDVIFLSTTFLPFYRQGEKTCLLLRRDVDKSMIQSFEHDFDGIIDSSAHADKIAGAFKLIASGYHVTDFIFEHEQVVRVDRGRDTSEGSPLSCREMQVAQELAAGLSNKEIALRLSISSNTVNAHLAAIRNKLDLRNRTEIALWMYKDAHPE